jgi:cytochrome c-type biogenesis protein CcsB
MDTDLIVLRVAAALYLSATIAALAAVAGRHELSGRLLRWLLGLGLATHVCALLMRAAAVGTIPAASLGESLSILAVLLVGLFLLAQLRASLVALGAVVAPLAFGLAFAAMALKGAVEPLPPILHGVWFPLHVGISLLGDAVFALAFSASVLYLIQERRLKAHRGRGMLRHLPSLETLDRVSHTCLVWGLVLLTFGVMSGIVWAHVVWSDRPWMGDPKILFTLLVWVLYVVLLQGRMTAGWRGRWAAQLTIAGFMVIVMSLVGVNVFGLGIHGGEY